MSKDVSNVAVLFADIAGSTSIYDRFGDTTARNLIHQCMQVMSTQIAPYQGTLIKTIGDEILCIFPNIDLGLQAAMSMQKEVKNRCASELAVLRIRIGLHAGSVVREENDIFGDTVNVAARVASLAMADQILTTETVYQALSGTLKYLLTPVTVTDLKGKQTLFRIYRVDWDDSSDITKVNTALKEGVTQRTNRMQLLHGATRIAIDAYKSKVLIGRDDTCDLVVKTLLASRKHLSVELLFGQFILLDQSTNGTYLMLPNGYIIRIAREKYILTGSGTISLGARDFSDPEGLIKFSIQLAT